MCRRSAWPWRASRPGCQWTPRLTTDRADPQGWRPAASKQVAICRHNSSGACAQRVYVDDDVGQATSSGLGLLLLVASAGLAAVATCALGVLARASGVLFAVGFVLLPSPSF